MREDPVSSFSEETQILGGGAVQPTADVLEVGCAVGETEQGVCVGSSRDWAWVLAAQMHWPASSTSPFSQVPSSPACARWVPRKLILTLRGRREVRRHGGLGSHPRTAQPALVSSVAGVSLRAAGVVWRGLGLDTPASLLTGGPLPCGCALGRGPLLHCRNSPRGREPSLCQKISSFFPKWDLGSHHSTWDLPVHEDP